MRRSINRCTLICIAGAILLTSALCHATNYYVEITGNYTNDGLSVGSAWPTIPYAVLYSADGDQINVGQGDFTTEWVRVNKQLDIVGSDIFTGTNAYLQRHQSRTVVSYVPPSNVLQSSLMAIETNSVSIRNLTFDGFLQENVAAGVFAGQNRITIEGCTFRNIKNGYAVLFNVTNALDVPDSDRNFIINNHITNIICTNATGIFSQHAPATIANNDICTVTGVTSQAGIYVFQSKLTNGSTMYTSIDSNYLYHCDQAIWVNNFGGSGDKILIRDNIIGNSLVGIRVTAADGQAIISNNTISVGGTSTSTNATPARGIWVHADTDPWNTLPTDHQVSDNVISDFSSSTGTVGLLFEYDTLTSDNINNGIKVTASGNVVADFDMGAYVQSGTNGISEPASPLVDVVLEYNDFNNSGTWAVYADNMTNAVNASNNWFGVYGIPTNALFGFVDFSGYLDSGSQYTDSDGDGTVDSLDVDDDNDLLLDTNEVLIMTSPILADTDGDFQDDYVEYHAGTDPLDKQSIFKVFPYESNTIDNVVLSWPSFSNRLYIIRRSTNLVTDPGTVLTNDMAATPPTNTFTDTTAGSLSDVFYMLSVTNTP